LPSIPALAHVVPAGPPWEIKHDGYRSSAGGTAGPAAPTTGPTGVPRITDALRSLRITSATIDGEAVVCGAYGVSDFDRLSQSEATVAARKRLI